MSGEMAKCIACGEMVFYADEKVVGTWNGMPFDRFDVLEPEHYAKGVPEGYLVYCLDCAPCECGDHERFAPHRAAEIDKGNASV
jgi:hypothetical protein